MLSAAEVPSPGDPLDPAVDAVRADGGLVRLRPARTQDGPLLRELHAQVSDPSFCFRFFGLGRGVGDDYVDRVTRPAGPEHRALTAWIGDRLVGVAAFERVTADTADVSFLVADDRHAQGIGTLLFEHLAAAARRDGVTRFAADVLSENAAALRLLRDSGYRVASAAGRGVMHVLIDLAVTDRAVAAVQDREEVADWASLGPVLSPGSVAVVGASGRADSVGHHLLRNIIEGGFLGRLDAVNPHRPSILGVPCAASVLDLPAPPDLVVVAVPADQVPAVVADCGRRGARGVLLVTAGFGELGPDGEQRQVNVVADARAAGMRLIGPNCLGLLNTDPAVQLNATFGRLPMRSGRLALASQSGAVGVALVDGADRMGMGVAQFVSVGNKADVSTNDLLLAWQRDDRVDAIAVYAESLGNPRKFARIARRVAMRKPVVVLKAGRSPAGRRAGLSHTAAAAAADDVVDALFHQAGVLRVDTTEQLLDVTRVLLEQPLPAGNRVVIIGNAGGSGILAADAAERAGLRVVELPAEAAAAIRREVPSAASCDNPVDLGAGVSAGRFGAAVRVAATAPGVDAVLVVFVETAVSDPRLMLDAIAAAAASIDRPLLITRVGANAGFLDAPVPGRRYPVFAFPESAAAALALAARYGTIRRGLAAAQTPARPAGADRESVAAVLARASMRGPGWLDAGDVFDVLRRYGLTTAAQRTVVDADAAASAARAVGYPVAVKVAAGGVHKSEIGGVRVGLADAAAVREAFAAVSAAGSGAPVLVQAMVPGDLELITGGVQDAQFGPVVMVGMGGTLTSLLADRAFRLAPVTVADAEEMLSGLRMSPVLDGFRGAVPVDRAAVADLVTRIGWLVQDFPEIAELDLNPVMCRADRLTVVDARLRVADPADRPDPTVRRLP